jgi:tripartite ATP-independent transporter DctM subunit
MRKHKYEPGLATGVLAAGGSIGSMIPPSILFIIYAVLTEQSMGKMFLAGFLPGIMQAIFYAIVIYVMCKRNPSIGPPSTEIIPFREKMASLKGSWGILALFILVIGGIYGGVFTVIEAAGIGAFCSLLFVIGRRMLTPKVLRDSLNETITTTAMCFMILIGTMFFNYFLAVSRIPTQLSDIVAAIGVNRYAVLTGILVVYLFLGCFMGGFAMITLTVPIFFPIIVSLGFDPIWFGILVTRMCEIGVITPPVGINVYVITGIAKDIPMSTVFKGIIPFLYSDFIQVAILVAFPIISLLLPNMMK